MGSSKMKMTSDKKQSFYMASEEVSGWREEYYADQWRHLQDEKDWYREAWEETQTQLFELETRIEALTKNHEDKQRIMKNLERSIEQLQEENRCLREHEVELLQAQSVQMETMLIELKRRDGVEESLKNQIKQLRLSVENTVDSQDQSLGKTITPRALQTSLLSMNGASLHRTRHKPRDLFQDFQLHHLQKVLQSEELLPSRCADSKKDATKQSSRAFEKRVSSDFNSFTFPWIDDNPLKMLPADHSEEVKESSKLSKNTRFKDENEMVDVDNIGKRMRSSLLM